MLVCSIPMEGSNCKLRLPTPAYMFWAPSSWKAPLFTM